MVDASPTLRPEDVEDEIRTEVERRPVRLSRYRVTKSNSHLRACVDPSNAFVSSVSPNNLLTATLQATCYWHS
jgi:hypothetical protein